MEAPPKNCLHIAIFGRKNAGKSSLMNALSGHTDREVSEHPGTTSDPYFLSMQLEPIGSVVLIDTHGLEEETSELAIVHGHKHKQVMDQTDIALLMFTDTNEDYSIEQQWYQELTKRHIPVIGVINRIYDRFVDVQPIKIQFDEIPVVKISARNKINLHRLKEAIRRHAPLEFERSTIVGDLIQEGDLVLLLTPQEMEAPRYRLSVPHAQLVRDLLDNKAIALSAAIDQFESLLLKLGTKPDLIITESTLFDEVANVSKDIPITTFSILLARLKGDLDLFIRGAQAIEDLQAGDHILVVEGCTEHELKGDIQTGELPKWLSEKAGGELHFTVIKGNVLPKDLTSYKMILHCGACAFSRKQTMARLTMARQQQVPITNFGVAYAYLCGILDRIAPIHQ